MNTRLQVEHPVTEEVTGLDLVEQMIRVAAGEKLKFKQDDVKLNGWAVETRVYAEDPYRSFLPSTGRLIRYWPSIQKRDDDLVVRVDDGVADGGEVSMFYDPMIAKLITHAPTRIEAIEAQVEALDQFVIDGINDNVDFLSALMQHPRFREGNITTNFIAEEYPEGFEGAPADKQLIEDLTAIAGMVSVITDDRAVEISDQLGERPHFPCERVVKIAGEQHKVRIKPYKGGTLAVTDDGDLVDIVGRWVPGQRLLTVVVDGRLRTVQVRRVGRNWELQTRGASHKVQVFSPHVASLAKHMIEKEPPDLSRLLLAPMPGLLTKLDVAVGDKVEPGQPVAVMEAMKMENILRAPKAATVKATPAKAGDSLAVDQVIVEFE
jgi:propionyl-CoA carboxylase alpha chain